MYHDVAKGGPLEVDGFSGHIVREGKPLGVPTPHHAALYAVLKPHAGGLATLAWCEYPNVAFPTHRQRANRPTAAAWYNFRWLAPQLTTGSSPSRYMALFRLWPSAIASAHPNPEDGGLFVVPTPNRLPNLAAAGCKLNARFPKCWQDHRQVSWLVSINLTGVRIVSGGLRPPRIGGCRCADDLAWRPHNRDPSRTIA
jgi:Ketopantoate reductase PanE/ApbA C terminal